MSSLYHITYMYHISYTNARLMASGATLELQQCGSRIARIGRWLVHEEPRVDFSDGTGKVH